MTEKAECWGDLTGRELAARLASGPPVVLLPVGSVEAHGPHLPLALDRLVAEGVAQAAARLLADRGRDALLLPALPFAFCGFLGDHPGTLSVPGDAVEDLLVALAASVFAQGVRLLVLVNGHLEPEHCRTLRRAAERATTAGPGRCIFPDHRRPPLLERLGGEFRRGGGHGGGYETSLLLAIRPELVRDDVRRSLPRNEADLASALRAGARSAREIGGEEGYFGDPAGASREEGERLLALLADFVARAAESALAATEET